MGEIDFNAAFTALTGNPPFPWQSALYKRFIDGDFPPSCSLPTGLGKTSVIHIWLLALVNAPDKVPRRLVYVVNRRTVVDQSTNEARKLRDAIDNDKVPGLTERLWALCADVPDIPLAISTLRGQFADNREWSVDPARPAVIAGTVDMIGSRLLFSGYGCGFKSRPLQAGFLAQDVLLVHDEAHLEPAFQCLLTAIQKEQERCGEFHKFRVMELTATSRGQSEQFRLTPDDNDEPTIQKRIGAVKRLVLHQLPDEKKTAEEVIKLALAHKGSNQAILIFLRKLEDVEKVAAKLPRGQVERLTGTLRGYERDRLATENPIFARFLPPSERKDREVAQGTVYLVCTSAGEVGVNISADHLICDLTPFDSMAQRFGRVNRFGDGDARIDIVHPAKSSEEDYELRRHLTLDLLRQLEGNGSPAALNKLPPEARQLAFSPPPKMLSTSDILFDAWALTSVCKQLTGSPDLPGRPPIAEYLHGVEDEKQAETYVAWREEVWLLRESELSDTQLTELLNDYPLKPHELLRDSTYRKNTGVRDHLTKLAARQGDLPVWIQEPRGDVYATTLAELIKLPISGRTVILPPRAGGLAINGGRSLGVLDGAAAYESTHRSLYDVADVLTDDAKRQFRVRKLTTELTEPPNGMRRVAAIQLRPESDEREDQPLQDGEELDDEATFTHYQFFVRPRSADDDASKTARDPIMWDHHTNDVVRNAARIADAVLKDHPNLHKALVLAAQFHDLGKKREVWQKSIGNPNPTNWLAKSGRGMVPREITEYRHEFGSLLDILNPQSKFHIEFNRLPSEDARELMLHLIATHHGRGRPHFPIDEVFDPGHHTERWHEVAREVPRRYAQLQRKYGRWGLAYLESLLRAADAEASADPSPLPGEEVIGA